MSFSYRSTAFALPAAEVPSTFASTDALLDFMRSQTDRARQYELELQIRGQAAGCAARTLQDVMVLCGASSSGWFDRVLEAVLKESAVPGLGFLTDNEDDAPFVWPDEDWRYRYTVLDAPRIDDAIRNLHALFEWARNHTSQVGELIDWYSPDEVAAAIHHTDTTWDASSRLKEGLGPDYLFVFLRSFLTLLERARDTRRQVVFFQKQPD